MAVTDAEINKLRADLALATQNLATVTGQVRLLASQQNDLALQLASGIVVRRRVLSSTPPIPQGYGVASVSGGVRLADAAGLALVTMPSGIAIAGAQPDEFVYIATGGIRPASETGLPPGVATAVGQDVNGKLVRADDPTCVPGFYYGDCNTAGDLTIGVRTTAMTGGYTARSWQQPAFYFSDAGSDANDGATPGTPIVTNAEYLRRTGFIRDVPQLTTLYHSNDRPVTDPLRQVIVSSPNNGGIRVFPLNLTVVRTGTLASYLPDNYATPEAALITDVSSGVTFTPGDLIRLTSGPRAGNTSPESPCNGFYIAKDLGSGQARVQSPTYHTNADFYNTYEFAPVGSETYEIVRPRKVALDFMTFGMPPSLTRASVDVYFIEWPGGFITGDPSYPALVCTGLQTSWCKFPIAVPAAPYMTAMSCCVGSNAGGGISAQTPVWVMYHTLFLKCNFSFFAGKMELGGKTLFQGCGAWNFGNAGSIHTHGGSGCQMIFDSTSTIFNLVAGVVEVKGKLFGKNNTGALAILVGAAEFVDNFLFQQNFRCSANGEGTYNPGQYDFNINGSTSGFAINPATGLYDAVAIDYTWPKLQAAYGAGGTGGFGGTIKHPVHAGMVLKGY